MAYEDLLWKILKDTPNIWNRKLFKANPWRFIDIKLQGLSRCGRYFMIQLKYKISKNKNKI